MFRMQDQKFLDDSIPALDGATPREAARDPNLLPRLKLLLKQRIHGTDQMNLRTGASYNPRWYIEELGVTGLSLAMPPTRPKTETLGLPKTPVPPEIE